jgi:shikimate kinase/3-dehydroquinate synthase
MGKEMAAANIILTGMMGAGKSTIGRILADKLERSFVDLDTIIERRAGITIQEVFQRYGEAQFRAWETETLKEILACNNQVVATGGGIVASEENHRLMQGHPVVWLAIDSNTAARRLTFDGQRPLLASTPQGEDGGFTSAADQGIANWRRLEKERRWAYSMCDWVVDAISSPEAVVDEITAWWQSISSKQQFWKTEHLPVEVPDSRYCIHIGHGILRNLGNRCRSEAALEQVLLVSNPTVFELYGTEAVGSLQAAGLKWDTVLIPDGEEHKHLKTVESIYSAAVEGSLDRRSGIIALGGGVVGDVAGFAAATYMRGIKLIQVPTTLLAQVDSSVGGKVGVNHPHGKNLIGSFYQPDMVLVDLQTLKTLPHRQFLTGMAEIIKYAFIADRGLITELEEHANSEIPLATLTAWVGRSCRIKAEVVAQDAHEMDYREILNFGHTIGHGVEKVAGYGQYTHGEAVAIGMVTAAILSYLRGYLKRSDCQRVVRLLETWQLPTDIGELSVPSIIATCRLDKKVRGGQLRFVLLEHLGKARVGQVVTEEELNEAFQIQKGGGL